jgi:hypothetical protein
MTYAQDQTDKALAAIQALQVMAPELAWTIQTACRGDEEVLARAAGTLYVLLEGIRFSPWQEVAWRFSYLTGDGFPVECVFSSADCDVRYTTEVAGPESDPAQRLEHADQLLNRLGVGKLPEINGLPLRDLQVPGDLRYGTWIGARHCSGKDRFKLYIEVPPTQCAEGAKLFLDVIGDSSVPSVYRQELCLIGLEIGFPRIEFYFRLKDLTPAELRMLVVQLGLGARLAELLDLMSQAIDKPIRDEIPGSAHGFSLSVDSRNGLPIFSLFGFARSFFGSDSSIRRHLLKLADKRGWILDQYARCSQPLRDRMSWKTFHGIVSFVLKPEAPPVLQIGMRPTRTGVV